MCDGFSFTDHGTILYAPTPGSRRENFTLLHEYAHVLVDQDIDASVWLADLEHPSRELEALCDEVAGLLLIPNSLLERVVGDNPVTGQHVLELFKASPAASQIVCTIAIARRLRARGAVMLTDRDSQEVVYAALVDNPSVYPSTGQPIPPGHPLRVLQPGQTVAARSFWQTPWGSTSPYYLHAAASTRRTYAVIAEDDLWNVDKLHLTSPEETTDARAKQDLHCRCGFSGAFRGWPCPECKKPICPRCGQCDCQRRAAQQNTCQSCGLTVPRLDLDSGICSSCR